MALVLDGFTPSGAYSTRRVLTAYAGQCLRIRATGDSVESDFGFVSDVVDTAGIASFIATHGGTAQVVSWYDQSGNGRTCTQATTANQPTFQASGTTHGNPSINFDGSNDTLASSAVVNLATMMGTNAGTLMIGQYQNSAVDDNCSIFCQNGSDRFNVHASSGDSIYFDYGTQAGGRINAVQPTGWDNAWHIYEAWRQTDNTETINIDGTLLVSASRSAVIPSATATMYLASTAGVASWHKGEFTEYFLFASDLGSSSRSTIRSSMLSFVGLGPAPITATAASTLTALTSALIGGSGQALFANADVDAGSWTTETGATTGLYAKIGETSPDDTTYIRSVEHPSASTVTLAMGDPIQPLGTGAAGVVIRYYKEGSETINLTVRLLEGASVIKTWTYTNISSTLTQANETLTAGEVATIVDPANLRWKYEASSV